MVKVIRCPCRRALIGNGPSWWEGGLKAQTAPGLTRHVTTYLSPFLARAHALLLVLGQVTANALYGQHHSSAAHRRLDEQRASVCCARSKVLFGLESAKNGLVASGLAAVYDSMSSRSEDVDAYRVAA